MYIGFHGQRFGRKLRECVHANRSYDRDFASVSKMLEPTELLDGVGLRVPGGNLQPLVDQVGGQRLRLGRRAHEAR
jgi:hypothetical protein